MKTQESVERVLVKATYTKSKLNDDMPIYSMVNAERIKVLTWVLSDLDKDLDEV